MIMFSKRKENFYAIWKYSSITKKTVLGFTFNLLLQSSRAAGGSFFTENWCWGDCIYPEVIHVDERAFENS